MLRYSDCYKDCGGEDCACCEIHVGHVYDSTHPSEDGDAGYISYGSYGPNREEEIDEADSRTIKLKATTPCDHGECPYDARSWMHCRDYCGLGVDE